MEYKTTRPLRSLAEKGVNVGKGQPVTPGAFAPEHWAALLEEGAVVAVSAPVTAVNVDALNIDQLKAMADELGVPYTWNIKAETLRERIRDAETN